MSTNGTGASKGSRPNGLNTLFLVHGVVAAIMGIVPFLTPEVWGNLVDWGTVDPTVTLVLGGVTLGAAYLSWLGYRTDSRDVAAALVKFEVVFPMLFGIAALYEVALADALLFTWALVVVGAVFAVASGYFSREMGTVPAADSVGSTA